MLYGLTHARDFSYDRFNHFCFIAQKDEGSDNYAVNQKEGLEKEVRGKYGNNCNHEQIHENLAVKSACCRRHKQRSK